jgi:hypothetical protein
MIVRVGNKKMEKAAGCMQPYGLKKNYKLKKAGIT